MPVSKFTMLMTTRENRLENIFAPLTYRWEIYSVESDLQISVQKKVPLMAKAQTATASGAAACANRLWLCPWRVAGSGKARACIPRSVSENEEERGGKKKGDRKNEKDKEKREKQRRLETYFPPTQQTASRALRAVGLLRSSLLP